MLEGVELLVQPRPHLDGEIPVLVRLEREREGHRVTVEAAWLREDEPRAQIAARIDDRDLVPFLVVGRRRGRWERPRQLRVAEREVVELHGDDVREVGLGLERDVDLEALRALVAQRDLLLHARADEALARDEMESRGRPLAVPLRR